MTEPFSVEDLLNVYNADFLGYVLNETRDQVIQRLTESNSRLGEEKETVLNELVTIENLVRTLPQEMGHNFQRNYQLSQYRPQLGSTLVAFYRKICGGKNEVPVVNDEVERLLLYFGEVTYPLRLRHDQDLREISSTSISIHQDPTAQQLHSAVMADEILSKLYPNEDQHMGRSGSVLRSTGRGGGIQLAMFAENLTGAAWHYAHFQSERPSFDEYARAILHIVRMLKKALGNKQAKVPMRLGLAGVLLPQGVDSVDFGWARLRPADQRDEYFTQRIPLTGQLQHTNAQGENIQIDYVGNLILELDIPFKIVLKELNFTDPWPDELRASSAINEPIECLRLALILAAVGEGSAAFPTWQSVVDPFSSIENIGFSDPRIGQNLLPAQLTEEQVESWREWATTIRDHRTPQTNVSVRRILRAVSEIKEPEDTLIDAVIVWENLFGASQETTLRVTMSVAWMLGTDGEDRSALFNELKEIYQQRSGIVHGNASLKTSRTGPYAGRAVDISIQLLRIIFRDHPELLKLKTGADRSALVLLNALDSPEKLDGSGTQ